MKSGRGHISRYISAVKFSGVTGVFTDFTLYFPHEFNDTKMSFKEISVNVSAFNIRTVSI